MAGVISIWVPRDAFKQGGSNGAHVKSPESQFGRIQHDWDGIHWRMYTSRKPFLGEATLPAEQYANIRVVAVAVNQDEANRLGDIDNR